MQLATNLTNILNAKKASTPKKAKAKYTGWSYVSTGILPADYPTLSLWEKNGKSYVADENGMVKPEAANVIAMGEDGKPLASHYTGGTHVFHIYHDESDADRGFETIEQAMMYMYGYDVTEMDEEGNEIPILDGEGNPIHVIGLLEVCRGIEFKLLKHPTNGTYFWCNKWHAEERDGKHISQLGKSKKDADEE